MHNKHTEKAKHIMKLMRPSKRRSWRGGNDGENIHTPSSQPVLLKVERRTEEERREREEKMTEESVIEYLNNILSSYSDESPSPTSPYDNETFFFEKDEKVNALPQRRDSKVFDVYYSSSSCSSGDGAVSRRINTNVRANTDKLCQQTIERYLTYEESLNKSIDTTTTQDTRKTLDAKTNIKSRHFDKSHAQNVILDSLPQTTRKQTVKSNRSESMYINVMKNTDDLKEKVSKTRSCSTPQRNTTPKTQTNTRSFQQKQRSSSKRQTPNKEYTISLYKTTDNAVGQNTKLVCTVQAS